MKVWLYYRLSRDEDEKMESLKNQRQIIFQYALQHGYEIVGESYDDNKTGMNFDRERSLTITASMVPASAAS